MYPKTEPSSMFVVGSWKGLGWGTTIQQTPMVQVPLSLWLQVLLYESYVTAAGTYNDILALTVLK